MRSIPAWGVIGAVVLLLLLLPPGAARPVPEGAPSGAHNFVEPPSARLPPVPESRGADAPWLAGGREEMRVDPSDPAIVPNEGVEMNLTAFTGPVLPANSAFQVAEVAVIGAYQAVFGVFQNTTFGPVPFYALFSNASDQYLALDYWWNLELIPGDGYLFALSHTSLGAWEFTVNGVPFDDNATSATRDLNASEATWSSGSSFTEQAAYGGVSFDPPPVTATLTIAVLASSGWELPEQASTTTVGSIADNWGIAGRLQDPWLAPGEVLTGPAVAPVAPNTTLWSGGPVPVDVSVSVAPPTLAAGTGGQVSAVVTDTEGSPIPGVFLYLNDSEGGLFSPALAETGGRGNASVIMLAPNVSSNRTDDVEVRVVLFGFLGSGTASVFVTAAVRAFFFGPSEVDVATGGSVGVTFRLRDAGGNPLPGVPVQFRVNGSAGLQPTSALTDGTGAVATTLDVGEAVTVIRLTASVDGGGYWGNISVLVHVNRVSPSTPLPWVSFAVVGVVALFVALLAYGLLKRPRRPRTPLPPLGPLSVRRPPP